MAAILDAIFRITHFRIQSGIFFINVIFVILRQNTL